MNRNSNKSTILVVDDNQENTFALKQMLLKPNRKILTASSGNEALKTILNEIIDLIILDVQMPDMDGFEVAQILKSRKRTKDIPIIFASAEKKEHRFMMKGFEEGGVDYLYKPLNPEITEAKVSVMLQLYLQKKELVDKNLILEKYALLINNSADIICIINPRTLKFEEVNNAITSILGYSIKEFKDTSLLLYISENENQYIQKLVKGNKEEFSFETRAYTKKREIKWLHWNIINKNSLWFANARDITQVKEVEEIRNYLATVVKQSRDAIYLHNAEGKVISWNEGAEKMYGFKEEEALRMNIRNIVPEHLLEETQRVINGLLNGKNIQSWETKRITKFGKLLDVMLSASVIYDSTGNLKSIAITERDITVRKKYEEKLKQQTVELREVNKELEFFSYSVSHDLRAPLRAIDGYAQMLAKKYGREGMVLDEKAMNMIAVVRSNASSMETLINDLLSFFKAGKSDLNVAEVDIYKLTLEMVALLGQNSDKHVFIEVRPMPVATCDANLIKQVLQNLISNAIKYSSKVVTPKIIIGAHESDEDVIYYVKDNGAGFDMKYAEKLFEVFERLHSSDEFEGNGIGLALVQKIIRRHRGKIWADSKPGKGATFFFTLPLENAP